MRLSEENKLGFYTLIPFFLGLIVQSYLLWRQLSGVQYYLLPAGFYIVSFVMGAYAYYEHFTAKNKMGLLSFIGAALGILPIILALIFIIVIKWVQ